MKADTAHQKAVERLQNQVQDLKRQKRDADALADGLKLRLQASEDRCKQLEVVDADALGRISVAVSRRFAPFVRLAYYPCGSFGLEGRATP